MYVRIYVYFLGEITSDDHQDWQDSLYIDNGNPVFETYEQGFFFHNYKMAYST